MPALEQKLQSLNPVPARTTEVSVEMQPEAEDAAAVEVDAAADGGAGATADSQEG
jgi:hypothetical protein